MKSTKKSITYNPGKRDFIQNAIAYLLPTAFLIYELLKHPHDLFWLIITIIFLALDVVVFYYMSRDPTCKTYTTITCEGVKISFSNGEEPIFVPWDNNVYVNICIEEGYSSYRQLIQRRVLCLSNKEITDDFVSHKRSVNWTHKMPIDSNEQWMVFLVVSMPFTCKKEKKRVCAFRDAALMRAIYDSEL